MRASPALTELSFSSRALEGAHSWWRIVLTLLLTIGALLLGSFGMVLRLMQSEAYRQRGLDISNFSPEAFDIQTELFTALLLLPFVLGLLVFLVCLRWIHKRNWQSLIAGRAGKIRWKRLLSAMAVWMLLMAIFEIFAALRGHVQYTYTFEWRRLFAGFAVVILLLPLQVAFEELTIRGYFHQLLSKWTHRPWIAALLTSSIFALLHLQNPEVLRFGESLMLSYYFIVGLFLALLSILDEGLELALGVHLAINFFGALIVNYESSVLPMKSLWLASGLDLRNELFLFVLQAAVFIALFSGHYKLRFGAVRPWNLGMLWRI